MKKNPFLPITIFLGLAAVAWAAEPLANWENNCVSCHGKDGKGATKAGRTAGVKDLTDAAYQAKFTDADAAKRITDGLKDDAGKEKMKPFAEKLSSDEIKALVEYIRTLKAK